MGQYRIKSEPLGVDFMVQGDQAPNAKSTFQILKQVVSPDKMIRRMRVAISNLPEKRSRMDTSTRSKTPIFTMYSNRPLVRFLRD